MLCSTWKFILWSDGWFGDSCTRAGKAAYHRATSNAQDSARPFHDRREHHLLSTYRTTWHWWHLWPRSKSERSLYSYVNTAEMYIQYMYRMYHELWTAPLDWSSLAFLALSFLLNILFLLKIEAKVVDLSAKTFWISAARSQSKGPTYAITV